MVHGGCAVERTESCRGSIVCTSVGATASVRGLRPVGRWVAADRIVFPDCYFDDGSVEFLIACMPTYIIIRKHAPLTAARPPGDDFAVGGERARSEGIVDDRWTARPPLSAR